MRLEILIEFDVNQRKQYLLSSSRKTFKIGVLICKDCLPKK